MSTPSGAYKSLDELAGASPTLQDDASSGFEPGTLPPAITFQVTKSPPPSNLYVTKQDTLRVRLLNAAVGASFALAMRVLLVDGTVLYSRQDLLSSTDRFQQDTFVVLPEGFIIGLSVFYVAFPPVPGATYCVISLVRSSGIDVNHTHTLCSGQLLPGAPLGWPPGKLDAPTANAGQIVAYTAPDPGVGNEIVVTVPPRARWRICSFCCFFVTSAVVGTRQLRFRSQLAGAALFTSMASAAVAAGDNRRVTWGPGLNDCPVIGGDITTAIPDNFHALAGWTLESSTNGLDPGDSYINVRYVVEEWLYPS